MAAASTNVCESRQFAVAVLVGADGVFGFAATEDDGNSPGVPQQLHRRRHHSPVSQQVALTSCALEEHGRGSDIADFVGSRINE